LGENPGVKIAQTQSGPRRESQSSTRTGPWDRGYAAGYRRGILDGEARARDGYRVRLAELEAQLAQQHIDLPAREPRPVDGDVADLFVGLSPREQVVDVPPTPQPICNVPEVIPIGEPIGSGNDAVPDPTGIVASTPPVATPRTLVGAGAATIQPDRLIEDSILSHVCLKMTTVRRTIVNLHIAQRHLEAYMVKHHSDWSGKRKLDMRDRVCLRWLKGEGDEQLMVKAIGDSNRLEIPYGWLYKAFLGTSGLKQAKYWYRNNRLEGRAMRQSSPLLRYRWHIIAGNAISVVGLLHAVRKGRFKASLFWLSGVIGGSLLGKYLLKFDTQVIPLD